MGGESLGTNNVAITQLWLCLPYSYPEKVCLVKVVTESFQDGGIIVGKVLESKFSGYASFCCSS